MSAAFTGGVPNIFSTPLTSFPPRQLFHVTGRPAEGAVGAGGTFTQEDRLLLHLLYQQQQAVQIQLQSMALSIQQLCMVVSGLSQVNIPDAKPEKDDINKASAGAGAANTASVAHARTLSCVANASVASSNARSRPSEQREEAAVAEHHSVCVQHQGEISRSCTPPPEDSDVSRQSAMNRSTESAAPWDPAVGSRHSSTVRGGRGENPLLSSLRGKLPTPNRSGIASTSVGTGHSASVNVSSTLDDSRPTARPTVRRSASSTSHLDQDVRNMASSLSGPTASRQHVQQRHSRRHVVMSSRTLDVSRPPHYDGGLVPPHACVPSNSVAVNASAAGEGTGPEAQDYPKHRSSSHDRTRLKDELGESSGSVTGYDSQSDDLGSYESKQYMKMHNIIN
uniref:Uncharacterized protein n=1 Tax=Trypanosoma congolense (strain IL3000) TaxID=1068625 RepID=G0UW76_TRYCI|nr:conserved hypothetical protein [Trypanosoma congolense IL3000]